MIPNLSDAPYSANPSSDSSQADGAGKLTTSDSEEDSLQRLRGIPDGQEGTAAPEAPRRE
jgi:hypothetical protein